MNKTTHIVTMVVLIIIIAAGTFYGGMKYQQSKIPAGFGMRTGNRQQGTRTGFRPVSGEIISTDDKSITVKLQDSSSKIVLFSDKTAINKADKATKADLKTGTQVAIFGTENTDGSITAQSIQLNPGQNMFRQNPQQ